MTHNSHSSFNPASESANTTYDLRHRSKLANNDIPCRKFFNIAGEGPCRSGSLCPFSHNQESLSSLDVLRKIPCLFWKTKGGCKNAESCFYSHAVAGVSADLYDSLDNRVSTIIVDSLTPHEVDVALCGYADLSSYSWLSHDRPTIIVPGLPPRLKLPALPFSLSPDILTFDVDAKGSSARPPPYRFRFEPLIQSISLMTPSFKLCNADIVTGLGCLRQLLSISLNTVWGRFGSRIDLELIGTTLFLSRWHSNAENSPEPLHRGYGHGFEVQCMTPQDCPHGKPTSYHRVVNYTMGGLNCVVQFEADAFDGTPCSPQHPGAPENAKREGKTKASEPLDVRNISDAPSDCLSVVDYGTPLDIASIVEVKTRAHNSRIPFAEALSHMWFSGIRTLVLGQHSSGVFDNITVQRAEHMESEIGKWLKKNDVGIRRFYRLLTEVRNTILNQTKVQGDTKYALVCAGTDKETLELYQRGDGQAALPAELLGEFH